MHNVFDQSDYQKWLCAMQGYSYVNTVYQEVYSYLRDNGDFVKALDDTNLGDNVREMVIQNIFVSYLNNFEKLDDSDSLLSVLLNRKQFNELMQLIWFAWILRGESTGKIEAKVYQLWPVLLEDIDLGTKEGRMLASTLTLWTVFLEQIDSISEEWLLKIAPHAAADHNSYDLLMSLARISANQPMEAQRIWIKMLDSYSRDYPEEAIRQILTNLVAQGPEGVLKAKEVLDAYIKYGMERPKLWFNEIVEAHIGRPIDVNSEKTKKA